MVIKRSFQLPIVRVAIIAGIAQAVPEINGITLLPLIPNLRIILSIKNTTLLIYPDSSRIEINRNKIAICGIKITTPPTPGITPSVSKSVNIPAGNCALVNSAISANKPSIKSIGVDAQSKIDWNISNNNPKKITYPNILCVKTLSSLLRTSVAFDLST